MTSLAHDGAASLEVRHMSSRGRGMGQGWYVVRTCQCHKDEAITVPFERQEEADRALEILDLDARQRWGNVA